MSARVGAGRAATMLLVHEAMAIASARQARLSALVGRMHELSDLIESALDHEPEHVVHELEAALFDVSCSILRLTSQRDDLGALRPFADWVTA